MRLLEREPFLATLDGFLRDVAAGQGRLVFLGGEAGVGKTVLVHHFSRSVEGRARVLIGACDPLSTPRPLGPLADLAGGVGGGLERSLQGGQRDEVFRGFLSELSTVCTLAVFEDVHWADEATLDLLRFLGRRLGSVRALLIATYRDDEVGPRHPLRVVMGDLATSPHSRRLALPRLSEDAVRTLAEGSGLDPLELYRKTSGNPFYVTEVLAAGTQGIPPTVHDAVLARVARLSPEGQAALEACAVIGSRIEPWLLGELTGSGAAAAEACVAWGMLRSQGEVFTFRHELARDALLETLSSGRKLALHRAVLEALTRSGCTDLSRLAHHAEGAGDKQAVLEYAPAAARQAAAAKAHRGAAAQYARTLRFADELPPLERAALLEAYAHESAVVDQLEDAIAARREAIDLRRSLGDRLQESTNLAWLSNDLVDAGRGVEAEEASRFAISVLEGLPAGPELAFARMRWAYLRMLAYDNVEAISGGRQAIALARKFQDTRSLVSAYNVVGSAMLAINDIKTGRDYLERGLRLARQADLDNEAGAAYANLGSGCGEMRQFDHAVRYLSEGIDYCNECDLDSHRLYMTSWLALCRCHQGHWAEATELAISVIHLPRVLAISRIMALLALGRVRSRRGDPEVWDVLDEALELAAQTATLQRLAPVRSARAGAAYLNGDVDKTRAEARAAYDLALERKHLWFVGELAYWRWKAGDLAEPPPETAQPFALQISGRWAEAAAEWERLGCPYEAARALAESDDEQALRRAHAAFKHLGAQPMAARVAHRMRSLGFAGPPRGPRPSTLKNPANLTGRELEILRLMTEGLSNAEMAAKLFRSPKTIGHHVSAILAKLEVRNRTEAVREAIRLGILDQNREPENPN